MDTISRENNSMLPVAGVIVGALGLLVGAYAALTVSKVKSQLADDQPRIEKIDEVSAQAAAASSAASSVKTNFDGAMPQIQKAFTDIGNSLGDLRQRVQNIEDASKKAPAGGKKGKGGAAAVDVVAGPGEYVVKHGDTPTKIAHANGCTVRELTTVNPGINWSHLHPGQKIKLPEKKPAA